MLPKRRGAEAGIDAPAGKLLKVEPEIQPLFGNRYFLIKRGFGDAQFFRRLPGLLANFEDMIALRCAVRSGHNPGHPQADGFAQRFGQSCK